MAEPTFLVGFFPQGPGVGEGETLIFFFQTAPTPFWQLSMLSNLNFFFEECIDEIQIYQGSMGRLGL